MPFSVKGIALGKADSQPTVLLEDTEGTNLVSFLIGPAEARAILVELEGMASDEPAPHDAIAQLFRAHRFTVKHVEIDDLNDNGYSGRIYYRKGLRTHWLPLRAGDAVALAVRMKAPIFINPVLLHESDALREAHFVPGFDILLFDREHLESHLA